MPETRILNDFYQDSVPIDLFTAVVLGFEHNVIGATIENLEMRNIEGWTLLMYACLGGFEKIVEYLLNAGCSADVEGPRKETPLMLGVSSGNLNIVKAVLIDEKVDSANERGWTALFFATFYGRRDCVEYLISKGANRHARDNFGLTPIHLALKSGNESISALLLSGSEIEIKPLLEEAKNPLGPVIYQRDAFNSPKKKTSIFRKIRTYTLNGKPVFNKENESEATTPEIKQEYLLKSPVIVAAKSPKGLSPRPGFERRTPHKRDPRKPTVLGFLKELSLEKYWPIFRDEEVDFQTLLTFNETNLKEIGIGLYGPRRKILMAIQEYGTIHGTGMQLLKNNFWIK